MGVDLIALGKDPNIIFDGENFMRFQMIPGHQVLGGLKGCCVGTGGKDAYPWVMNKKCNLNTGLKDVVMDKLMEKKQLFFFGFYRKMLF